ncbi:hypothetical protein [Aureivirga sp. CE67]|uniref:hypothetical protein n=1 Tax=Aureivirga sp. CE67 TaxID=1788983 RepID=UPI0018C99506|nr:hypothetical protein [Aureivirga sp. CE67]
MKYFKVLLLFACICSSCSYDEEIISDDLIGDWKLSKIEEFDSEEEDPELPIDYIDKNIVFHFEPNGQLEISEDNNILEYGNYYYEIIREGEFNYLDIEGIRWGYEINVSKLILDRSFVYGPKVVLTRYP